MTIKLGEHKEIEITPWKAKTKKDFIRLFKEKEGEVSENEVMGVLISPYIDKPDTYYSPDEIQYILIELRKISISGDIEFKMDCDNEACKKEFTFTTTLDDLSTYTPSKYPIVQDGISWVDIANLKSVDTIEKKYPHEPPREISMLLHIQKYKDTVITKFEDILAIVDDLSLKEGEEIINNYDSVRSDIDISASIKCPHCNVSSKYQFDIIPTFYDPLLPKQK